MRKHIPVTYVLFPDEGHGFHRPENNTSFNAVTEAFLSKQLGGRYQPVGDDFKGSTITVPERGRSGAGTGKGACRDAETCGRETKEGGSDGRGRAIATRGWPNSGNLLPG